MHLTRRNSNSGNHAITVEDGKKLPIIGQRFLIKPNQNEKEKSLLTLEDNYGLWDNLMEH